MPDPRLIATITALMFVIGSPAARADFSLEELKALEQIIVTKDSSALRLFLASNPKFVRGEDPLARELRSFLNCLQSNGLDCFASPKPVATALKGGPAPTPAPAIY